MRIAVLGYSGAGKSTLAHRLGQQTGAPVLYLDTVQFTPGWQERDAAAVQHMVRDFMMQPNWIIEGNYHKFAFDQRITAADRIYILTPSRWTCLVRIVRRYWQYRGRTRPYMAADCPERLTLPFIWFVMVTQRTRARRQEYLDLARQYPDKVTLVRRGRQIQL